ncbi:hypothetical protein TI03_05070 [Achromatium sp. WMS1]|nr:hypothetical protein TI03_05070 [Achromatium sp. WMS1]
MAIQVIADNKSKSNRWIGFGHGVATPKLCLSTQFIYGLPTFCWNKIYNYCCPQKLAQIRPSKNSGDSLSIQINTWT